MVSRINKKGLKSNKPKKNIDGQKFKYLKSIKAKDISFLKSDTKKLVLSSLKNGHIEEEDVGDYIDYSIIDAINKINKVPNLVPTGSCSGHGGYPFISLVFKNEKIRDIYKRRFASLGYRAVKSNEVRMDFFKLNFPELKISEEWTFFLPRKCTKRNSKKYWDDCLKISNKPILSPSQIQD